MTVAPALIDDTILLDAARALERDAALIQESTGLEADDDAVAPILDAVAQLRAVAAAAQAGEPHGEHGYPAVLVRVQGVSELEGRPDVAAAHDEAYLRELLLGEVRAAAAGRKCVCSGTVTCFHHLRLWAIGKARYGAGLAAHPEDRPEGDECWCDECLRDAC